MIVKRYRDGYEASFKHHGNTKIVTAKTRFDAYCAAAEWELECLMWDLIESKRAAKKILGRLHA